MPALLNTRFTWSVACCSTTSSRNRATSAASATLQRCAVTLVPAGATSSASLTVLASVSGLRSHVATEQPSVASWMTSARPMPVPPPVTTASFPRRIPRRSSLAPRSVARSALRSVEVPEQQDLGAVVDDLAVDVEDELGVGVLGERALGGPDRPAEVLEAEARPRPWSSGRTPRRARPARWRRRRPRPRSGSRSGRRPKCEALRWPKMPTRMWAMRQAMVVTGAGSGSGNSKSATQVAAPGGLWRCGPPARGRMLQAALHGLPQVLLVGEAVEHRPEVVLPVPAELEGELAGQVERS